MGLKEKIKDLDYYIVIPYAVLCVIGIIMVFSASSNISMQNGGTANSYLWKQISYVILGTFFAIWLYICRNKWLRKGHILRILSILFFLVFIFLKFKGQAINGSPGWFNLFGFGIQPAEFVKFYFIVLYAYTFSRDEKDPSIYDNWYTFRTHHNFIFLMTALILFIIFFLPDLGGMLINFTIVLVMILSSGISYRRATRILVGLLAAAFGILYLVAFGPLKSSKLLQSNYMMQRVLAFSDPFAHANGVGQQLVNSYYAISNGGLFGTGIGNSIQKTGYLPEPNTDFIMAIIAEELGLIGVITIIVLLFIIVGRILYLGMHTNDSYGTLICYGTATYIVVQTYFNVGGVTGILPITGVTFPFISYGGSSMITLCLCLGLVLKVSRRYKIQRKNMLKG
ncbi:FtsW/RodA/SpoVE family cell cycle protein [Nicoliella lavandulae]|uniref:Probable peptidoglycan glycosyltransferase FtsW n=1 Tax=Nicoliella lavandulae TaxID=3082954 RepID=A0ABU8SND7_9LACO